MARTCIFCAGPSSAQGSGEHLFPDWLNRLFPVGASDPLPSWGRHVASEDGVGGSSWTAAKVASMTTKRVCNPCNTGWMCDLEGEASPVLQPMILGRQSALSAPEQLLVATWATKTAMVIESTLDNLDNFPANQCATVMAENRPPGSLRVGAAAVNSPPRPLSYFCSRVHIKANLLPDHDLHFYTLQVGTLVLTIRRPDPPPPHYGALKDGAVPGAIEIPVFPPVERFLWPPPVVLDFAGLVNLGRRGIVLPDGWDIPDRSDS